MCVYTEYYEFSDHVVCVCILKNTYLYFFEIGLDYLNDFSVNPVVGRKMIKAAVNYFNNWSVKLFIKLNYHILSF